MSATPEDPSAFATPQTPPPQPCRTCHGFGKYRTGDGSKKCTDCGGSGLNAAAPMAKDPLADFKSVEITCGYCNGSRYLGRPTGLGQPCQPIQQCGNCKGTGKTIITIQAPPAPPEPLPETNPLVDYSNRTQVRIPDELPKLPWTLFIRWFGPHSTIPRPCKKHDRSWNGDTFDNPTETEVTLYLAAEWYKRELERVKADKLQTDGSDHVATIEKLQAENAQLKAENQQLEADKASLVASLLGSPETSTESKAV